jgi:CotH protein
VRRVISTSIASLLFLTALGLLLFKTGRVAVQGPDGLDDLDSFLSGQALRRIDLYINTDDWRAVQSDPTARDFRPATLKWGDVVSRNVGVRADRARAAAGGQRPLHIDVSRYVSGATFLGLQSFTLDDLADDPSAVRRTVTLRFYAWMDLPSARAAHAALYVNNAFSGLYAVVEPLDHALTRYAAAHAVKPGHLYRYAAPTPYRLNYPGTDLADYQRLFRADHDNARFPFEDYFAIEEMIRALNVDAISSDERRLSTYVDTRQFIRIAAVQNFLAMSAGIAGRDGSTDFSLHVRRGIDPVQFLPNGESTGLLDPQYPIEEGLNAGVRERLGVAVASQRREASTVLDLYVRALLSSAAVADQSDDNPAAAAALVSEVDRQLRVVAGVSPADRLTRWTSAEIAAASAGVRRFARERSGFVRCRVLAWLQGGACGAPAQPSVTPEVVPAVRSSARGEDSSNIARAVLTTAAQPGAAATNIARGRPYTLAPRPNYSLTTDAGDDTQLTDGTFTAGTLWTRTSTVGWSNAAPVTIVVDLGSIQAISAVSYSTAAGTSGVSWPRSVFVLVSDDGQRFFDSGDLAAVSAPPSATEYTAFRFARNDLRTHGRYVALVVDPVGSYTFCDEVEVLAGDPAWTRTPLAGESTTDLRSFFTDARTRTAIQRRLMSDLALVRADLDSPQLDALRGRLTTELAAAENEIAATPTPARGAFRAVLPLNATHLRIFAVHGQAAQAHGLPPLSAWVVNPWDFVRPMDAPPSTTDGSGTLRIAAMSGETRSGAFNLSNATGRSTRITLSVEGASPGAGASDLRLYETIWTDTRELVPVADALVPLSEVAPAVDLPAGLTRQIWVSFTPSQRAAGTLRGRIEARADTGGRVSIPFELRVLAGSFPPRPSLHIAGWDYTDADQLYGLTPGNRDQLLQRLRELNVNTTWAQSAVMPAGSFDAGGHLRTPPDTSLFDEWVGRWPGASRYMVFVNSKDALGNVPIGDPRFSTAAGDWIRFWTGHAAGLGIQPSQLMLLLVDEPRSPAQDDRIVAWAKALKAAEPRVRIWEDPTYTDPATSEPQLLGVVDVVALKRSLMQQQGAPFVDFYRQRRARGQALDIYGASGHVRLLDPYTYYRLQAWMCADIGAAGSFFWSFIDDAGGSSWNEYAATEPLYSPFFLSPDSVTISKHSEAIREGAEDFEYLAMLRERVASLGSTNPNRPGLSAARSLLDRATATVLGASGAGDLDWVADKDRSAAERIRIAIAESLDQLSR